MPITDTLAPVQGDPVRRTNAPAVDTAPAPRPAGTGAAGAPVHAPAAPDAPAEPATVQPAAFPAGWKPVLTTTIVVALLIAAVTFAFSFGNVSKLADRLKIEGWIGPLVQPSVDLSVLGLIIVVQWLSIAGATADELKSARRLLWGSGVVTMILNAAPAIVDGAVAAHDGKVADAATAFGRAGMEAVAPWLLIGWSHVAPSLVRLMLKLRDNHRATVAAAAAAARQVELDRIAAQRAAEQAERDRAAELDRIAAQHVADERAAAEALAAAAAAELERAEAERQAAVELANAERAAAERAERESALLTAQADADRAAAERLAAAGTRPAKPATTCDEASAKSNTGGTVSSISKNDDSHREALRALVPYIPADVDSWAAFVARLEDGADTTVTQSKLERETRIGKRRILAALHHAERLLPFATVETLREAS